VLLLLSEKKIDTILNGLTLPLSDIKNPMPESFLTNPCEYPWRNSSKDADCFPDNGNESNETKHVTTIKKVLNDPVIINHVKTLEDPLLKEPKYNSSLPVKNRSVYDELNKPIIDIARNGNILKDHNESR